MSELEEKLRILLEDYEIDIEDGNCLVDTVREHVEFTEGAIKEQDLSIIRSVKIIRKIGQKLGVKLTSNQDDDQCEQLYQMVQQLDQFTENQPKNDSEQQPVSTQLLMKENEDLKAQIKKLNAKAQKIENIKNLMKKYDQ